MADGAKFDRRKGRITRSATMLLAFLVCISSPTLRAEAAPEEIQVYENDMDKPGQFGLDIHNSYVFGGKEQPDYPGEQQSNGRYRITPEFSYGLTRDVELGLYLPLASIDDRGHLDLGGTKIRVKYIAPHPVSQNWYYGVNFEIGRVEHQLDINPWNAELKGILGWKRGPWDLAINTNLDFAVSGPQLGSPAVQIATKVGYKVAPKVALGIESYNGAGSFHDFGTFSGAGHSTFGVVDTSIGRWDLNIGLGHGYSGERDQWIFKFIVSVPIDG